jgi:hypothetical protein
VFRGEYKGVPKAYHSGSTGGYRAFLTHYPSARLSVAVLCNAANANAAQLTRIVSDFYLGGRLRPDAPRVQVLPEARGPLVGVERDSTYRPTPEALAALAGRYRSTEIETLLEVVVFGDTLQVKRRPNTVITIRPHSRNRFDSGGGLGSGDVCAAIRWRARQSQPHAGSRLEPRVCQRQPVTVTGICVTTWDTIAVE